MHIPQIFSFAQYLAILLLLEEGVLCQQLEQLGKISGGARPSSLSQVATGHGKILPLYSGILWTFRRSAWKRWGINAHIVPESAERSLLAGFVGT